MVSSKNTENLKVITSAGETHHFPVKTNPDALNISKNWTVDFEPGRGAPGQIKSDTLISWTSHSDKGVNYFSGTASYKTQIFIPKTYLKTELKTELDLGEVKELAEVLINGQSIGILWNPPFVAEITGYLVQGKNELEIRITNTWVNRLIGDKNTPKDQQICRIYSPDPKWYTASSKLSLSGLLGPVVIRPSEIVTLKTKH